MITTNISGGSLSANYDTTVKTEDRDFLVKILKNNVQVDCGIKRLEITKGRLDY